MNQLGKRLLKWFTSVLLPFHASAPRLAFCHWPPNLALSTRTHLHLNRRYNKFGECNFLSQAKIHSGATCHNSHSSWCLHFRGNQVTPRRQVWHECGYPTRGHFVSQSTRNTEYLNDDSSQLPVSCLQDVMAHASSVNFLMLASVFGPSTQLFDADVWSVTKPPRLTGWIYNRQNFGQDFFI